MAELADALDSGSSEVTFVQVQVLLPAPNKHRNYDTKPYRKSGACFLFKVLIGKDFTFLFWGNISVRIKIVTILSAEYLRT